MLLDLPQDLQLQVEAACPGVRLGGALFPPAVLVWLLVLHQHTFEDSLDRPQQLLLETL